MLLGHATRESRATHCVKLTCSHLVIAAMNAVYSLLEPNILLAVAEKKLVQLGHKAPEDNVDMSWPDTISLQAAIKAAQLTMLQDDHGVPWRVHASESCDAQFLEEHGFHAKKHVEHTWTEEDVVQLKTGMRRLQTGEDLPPSQYTDPLYYLSHHVMAKKFSSAAVARQVQSMYHRSQGADTMQVPPELANDAAADAADLADHVGEESESEDEAIL